jgi:two-component system chemotaxis response regulator CheB
MDIGMPGMNGYEVTRKIMESAPTPIVMVSAAGSTDELGISFKAIESGALAVVPKPNENDPSTVTERARELLLMIKLMAEVKVVRRWARSHAKSPRIDGPQPAPREAHRHGAAGRVEAVVIGASTGGPMALRTILSILPLDFAASVLVVQHISPGFGLSFAEWLAAACRLPVRIAADGEAVLPSRVYLAPDGAHFGLEAGPRVRLGYGEPECGLRPSVAYLFRAAARVYGDKAVGVLLSGMGMDGAAELKALKDGGAVTFAQDEASCIIFGMPGEAVRLGGASFTMKPEDIAAAIIKLVASGPR